MAKRLWGCYSVADHLSEHAFVADLLLYDRLLIPTPAPDDLERWKNKWDPERQARMLEILGPFAERIEWSAPRQDEWEQAFSTQTLAQDADSAYQWTRAIIGRRLEEEVRTSEDVRALAVEASPDGFDRDWRLVHSPLFLRRATTVVPGELAQVMRATEAEHEELAKLVVTQLVVPNDGRDDYEVLERTVDLVGRPGVAERRAELHELIASLETNEGIRDQTVVAEVKEHLDALNQAVARQEQRNKGAPVRNRPHLGRRRVCAAGSRRSRPLSARPRASAIQSSNASLARAISVPTEAGVSSCSRKRSEHSLARTRARTRTSSTHTT